MKYLHLCFISLYVFSLSQVGFSQPRQIQQIGVDLENSIVDPNEIIDAGPPPNGIPTLGFTGDWKNATEATPAPKFVSQEEALDWLAPQEPVIVLEIKGEARAYPFQILIFHEVVNDVIADTPVMVTFCPLCNSALAFDRRVPLTQEQIKTLSKQNTNIKTAPLDEKFLEFYHSQRITNTEASEGLEVTFGVSGLLYNSNLIMFDSASSTLWSQLIGQAVVGQLVGVELLRYPAQILSFSEFQSAYPEAMVLSRDTGFKRNYGENPYMGYDDVDSPPYVPVNHTDERLAPKERVVSLNVGDDFISYPYNRIWEMHVIHDEVAGKPLVVFWQEGTNSALDSKIISNGRDVGTVGVFANKENRHFSWDGEGKYFVDEETQSHWNIAGQAIAGELAGSQLEPIMHDNTLWFAWVAFQPETRVYQP